MGKSFNNKNKRPTRGLERKNKTPTHTFEEDRKKVNGNYLKLFNCKTTPNTKKDAGVHEMQMHPDKRKKLQENPAKQKSMLG